jgi:hypothetical protein
MHKMCSVMCFMTLIFQSALKVICVNAFALIGVCDKMFVPGKFSHFTACHNKVLNPNLNQKMLLSVVPRLIGSVDVGLIIILYCFLFCISSCSNK